MRSPYNTCSILSNVAPSLQVMKLSGPTRSRLVDLFSASVYDEDDRAIVSCALETIARLCYCHENIMWLEVCFSFAYK